MEKFNEAGSGKGSHEYKRRVRAKRLASLLVRLASDQNIPKNRFGQNRSPRILTIKTGPADVGWVIAE